ncbi:MAG: PAS domain S-box protein [Opitutaceae bacterium]|nr:PAS domain S-box protein [Opitutaceae bacterium]
MNSAPFIALVHNAALLMALVLVYDLTVRRYPQRLDRWSQLAIGGILGLMGVGVMLAPFELVPGIVFDTRSVLLALVGLFFGVIPTAVAVVLTAAFRVYQGGAAAGAGSMVIVASAALGLVWHWRGRERLSQLGWRELYVLGLVVHGVMLTLMFTLGWSTGGHVVAAIGLPVIIIHPVVTVVLGLLLSSRLRRLAGEHELQRTTALLHMAGQLGRLGGWRADLGSHTLRWSDEVAAIHDQPPGYSPPVAEGISYYPPEWRGKIEACFKACATQGVSYDEEMEIITARGRRIWVHTRGEAVRDAVGHIVAVQGIFQDISERKRLELAMADARLETERMRDALDWIGSYVYMKDRDSRYTYANRATLELFKTTADELRGKGDSFYFPPAVVERLRAIDLRVLEHGEETAEEIEIATPDGTRRHYLEVKAPLRDPADPAIIVGLCGISTDITAQKQSEAALQVAVRQLESVRGMQQLIIESIPVRVFWKDRELRYLGCNRLFARDAGFTRSEELLGKDDFALSWRTGAEPFQAADREVMATGVAMRDIRETLTTASGTVTWLNTTKVPLRDAAGEIIGVLGVYDDITVRKQAEDLAVATKDELARLLAEAEQSRRALLSVVEDHQAAERALRASEDRWRHAVQGSAAGIWENDIVTGEDFYSDRSKEMLGYAPADIPASREVWTALIHPDDVQIGRAAIQEHLAGRKPYYEAEHRFRCKDGSYRWISSHARAVFDAQGRLLRISGTHVDIHERKLAEEKLRTSLREKEALLKEVHHRVKNNLQVIISLLRLEAGRSKEPSRREVLQEMQGRIRSMALLHETLYRSGNFAGVNLADYLRQVATQVFRAQNTAPGRVQLSLELAAVSVDMDQAIPCGLIVNELVTNSLKHAFPDARAGAMKVSLGKVGEGPLHQLEITDNGVGLPADFELQTSGTLGMQLVADLSRQLQGEFELGRGPGARFALRFTPRAPGGPQVT